MHVRQIGHRFIGLVALALVGACAAESPVVVDSSTAASLQAPSATGIVIYNNIPATLPPNVPSLGYQCCATAEFGDNIAFAGTARRALRASVLMSDWAKHSDYPTMNAAGYTHPITLNVYAVDHSGPKPALGALVGTVTQSFLIPWRPERDPSCSDDAWKAADGGCYHGFAFTITFDLRSLSLTLPNEVIVGVAYNTNTWGYNPIGLPGPYESLNVGTVGSAPSVGTDVEPDAVFWNTKNAGFYADGGLGGVGTFRRDTGWLGYAPALQMFAYGEPTSSDACKNGGWQAVTRSDASTFKNQGDCVSYVANGK